MEKITINAEFLFELKSKDQWVQRVPQILPEKTRSGEKLIWVDSVGNVFESGRDFEEAEKLSTYPCRVYRPFNVGGYTPPSQPSEQKPTTTISKSDGTGEIEIFQEVKDLAIAWIENYIPHNSIVPEIGQKWKLAEDIQRIVNQSMKQERERVIQECIEMVREKSPYPIPELIWMEIVPELEKLKK